MAEHPIEANSSESLAVTVTGDGDAELRIAFARAPGVLARIAGLFDRLGIEIRSLALGVGEDGLAELQVGARGPAGEVERLRRAIAGLVCVARAERCEGRRFESDSQFQVKF